MNQTSLEKMKSMRLLGMYRAFKTSIELAKNDQLTSDEMTALLVDSEWDDRHNRSIERTLKNARFRYKATIEQLDFTMERGVDKNQIHRMADGEFIKRKENILITGNTGNRKKFFSFGNRSPGLRPWLQSSLHKHRASLYTTKNGKG